MNHLETQYAEATNSFEQDLFTPFVLSGLLATKDGSIANQLDISAGAAFLLQADATLRRQGRTTQTTQTTSTPSTTYNLYLQPDGTFYWSTANSPATNSLYIAQVTTDGSGNISTVTDKRVLSTTLLAGFTGTLSLTGPFAISGGQTTMQGVDNAHAALSVSFPTAPAADTNAINVKATPSAAASSMAAYIRGSDLYGGIRAGTNTGAVTAHLYAQATGWKIDEGLILAGGPFQLDALGSVIDTGTTAPGAPTTAVVAGTALGVGVYKYAVSFTSTNGETLAGTQATATTTTNNQAVNLSAIPTGPAGTAGRKIYRTAVGGTQLKLLTTLSDNTTTTFADTTADGSLGANALTHPTLGGVVWKSGAGAQVAAVYGDGAISFDAGALTSDGAGNLTVASLVYGATGGVSIQEVGGVNGLVLGRTTLASTVCIANINSGGGIGFKKGGISGGTKIAEFSASGQLIVAAGNPSFVTTAGTTGTGTGSAFDTFDVAEVYETDGDYPRGTVLCPGPDSRLTRCTHDKCHAALVVSLGGAINIGGRFSDDEEYWEGQHVLPLALAGRVLVDCGDQAIPLLAADGTPTLVASNGQGGVRAMRAGERGFALGFALTASEAGQIGIVVRPLYCQAPSARSSSRGAGVRSRKAVPA